MKKITLLYIALGTLCCINSIKTNNHPTFVFAHGFADTGLQALPYSSIFTNQFKTFNFPDATNKFWRVNFSKSALGQTLEIKHLSEKLQAQSLNNTKFTCIGVGVSRGATVWLNYMGTHPSNDSVKALILESPPDDMNKAIPKILGKVFAKYDPRGIQSCDVIKNIPTTLPILIIGIKNDHRVPYESTLEVYRLLKLTGNPNVHFLTFEQGKHAFLMKDSKWIKQKKDYINVVHAFYKKYGFNYNPDFADQGAKLFAQTQPFLKHN